MADLSTTIRKEHRKSAFRRMGVSITYTQKSDSLALGTGTVTESDTDTTIGANTDADPGVLTSPMHDKDIINSGGKFKAGARIFKIRAEDMPETPPKRTSVITYSSDDFNVEEWHLSGDDNVYMIKSNQID